MRYVAYYRCSTKGQEESGLGLEAQRAAVHTYLGVEATPAPLAINALEPPFRGARAPRPRQRRAQSQGDPTPPSRISADILAEVVEVESGRSNVRPQLQEALRLCRMYRATLIIAKLDRLARNYAFLRDLQQARVT